MQNDATVPDRTLPAPEKKMVYNDPTVPDRTLPQEGKGRSFGSGSKRKEISSVQTEKAGLALLFLFPLSTQAPLEAFLSTGMQVPFVSTT
ncbi:MAG: hypothetical protein K2P57_12660 [Burkholderiales bacterium]|nr:hypothetical protein [Burkholderiales bacterium]